jgi:hypothetical protein
VRIKKLIVTALFLMVSLVNADTDPLHSLQEEMMAYFRPMTGKIISVDESNVVIKIDTEDTALPGMRFNVLRKGEPFYHPVTKELLGRFESIVGKIELRSFLSGRYAGILVEGKAAPGDSVRISETRIKMFFCQSKEIDWHIADEFYRRLKQTGRIEMLDSSLETDVTSAVLEEAEKLGAEVAILMTARTEEKDSFLKTRLFWVEDGSLFFDKETKIDTAIAKELKFGDDYLIPTEDEVLFAYDLPMDAKLVTAGDFDGNGRQEIALSNGSQIKVYLPDVDLQYLWELDDKAEGDHVWIDAVDVNQNGKDELVITSLRSGVVQTDTDELITITEGSEVVSYLYELSGAAFQKMWEGKYFSRKMGDALVLQAYSPDDGFAGGIFTMMYDGTYRIGKTVSVPGEMGIYDFVFLRGDPAENFIFAYDDKGFLSLYGADGIRIWRSRTNVGRFVRTYKKKPIASYLEAGEWAVKDRLIKRFREIFVIERIPLFEKARGIGYKNSRIKSYWWNGFSMEERNLISNVQGTILDYAVTGDKMLILSNPLLGIKFKNILKGRNPLGTMLFMYSLKGR